MLFRITFEFDPDYGRKLQVEQTYKCLSHGCDKCNIRFICYTNEVLEVDFDEANILLGSRWGELKHQIKHPSTFLEEYFWTKYGAQFKYIRGTTVG